MSEQPGPILHDVDAEQNVFSCILKEQVGIESVKLQTAEFHEAYHRVLHETMIDLWASNCPLTVGLIFHELVRTKKIAQAAPAGMKTKEYLDHLKNRDTNPEHIGHYAGIVRKLARVRATVKLAADVIKAAYDEQADPDALDSMITDGIVNIGGGENEALLTWQDSFQYYEAILDERQKKATAPAEEQSQWDFPWKEWNGFFDDVAVGSLTVFGAGTSVGKTIFGENIGEHWARSGHHVAYFHFELNRELMLDRRTVRFTGFHRKELLGAMDKNSRKQIADVNAALATWGGGVEYIHCPAWSIDQVIAQIRSMHAAGICDSFVIDYFEKLQGSDQQWRRLRDEFKIEVDNMERLKNVAESLKLRGLVLSQLTKDGNEIEFENLTMSKIRGAGQKSEKVNAVILAHRERLDNGLRDEITGKMLVEPGQRSNTTKIRIDKNTMGRTGILEMSMSPGLFTVTGK